MGKKTLGVGALAFALVAAAGAQAPFYSNRSTDCRIYALNATTVTDSGVAAAAGTFWSEVENDAGNTTESNTTAGFSAGLTDFRMADDFTIANGRAALNSVSFVCYQTGFLTAGLFTTVNVQIWRGRPGDTGSTVVLDLPATPFTETMVLPATASGATVTTGTVHRVFNTQVPAPGTAPGTTRILRNITVNLSSPLLLEPDTYWVQYQAFPGNAGTCFSPSTTHDESRQPQNPTGGGNARQWQTTLWADAIDAGNPAAAPDIIMEQPFILGGAQERWPTGTITILGGTLLGGNIGSLARSDDNRLTLICDEFDSSSDIRVKVNTAQRYNGANYVGNLRVIVESRSGRTDQIERVHLWNGTNWVQMGGWGTTLADTTHTVTVNNAGPFVDSFFDVFVRVDVIPSGDVDAADGWSNSYDRVNVLTNQ